MRRLLILLPPAVLLVLAVLYFGSPARTPGQERREVESSRASDPSGPAELAELSGASDSRVESNAERTPVASEPAPRGSATVAGGALLIVDAETGVPRPGLAARVLLCRTNEAEGEPVRQVVWQSVFESDAEGRADLAQILAKAPGAEWARFFPERNAGLRLEPFELSLIELSRDPLAPTVLRLHAREAAPVHALAVDASTGEPLPELALRTQRWIDMPDGDQPVTSEFSNGYLVSMRSYDATDCEWVVTDASGRFTTQQSFPSGRLGFLTLDQQRAELQHDGRHGAQPLRLEVPVGPRVLLAFTPGGSRSPEDYVAGLWRAPEELVSTEGVQEMPSPWSADRGRRAGYWGNAVPVQVGEGGAYARLGVAQVRDPLPSFLFLISRDGASFGFAALEEFERYRNEPLVVMLEERLALDCAIVWPAAAGDDADLDVQLVPSSELGGNVRSLSVDRVRGEERTAFHFQALAPGDYTLRLLPQQFQGQELDIRLPRFDTIAIHPRLAEPRELHEVAFRFLSDSGLPLDGEAGRAKLERIYLMPVDPRSGRLLSAAVVWSEGTGRARFTGVPPGAYRRQLVWTRGGHVVEPFELLIEVPALASDLHVRDTAATIRAEVRVFDPPLNGQLTVSASEARGLRMNELLQIEPGDAREQLPDGRTFLTFRTGPIMSSAQLRARLDSEEHRIVAVQDDAFSAPNRDGVRELEIHSQPGFNVRIWVWTVADGEGGEREHLPDIVLTFDGLEQDPTDASGALEVSLDEVPERIGVSTPGWRLVTRTSWDHWGSVFAETGKFTTESGYLDVILEPTGD